jgi:hypothetical protein
VDRAFEKYYELLKAYPSDEEALYHVAFISLGQSVFVRLLATAGSGSVAKRRSSGRVTVQALREEKIVRNRFTSRVGSGRQTAGKAQQAGALFGGREPSC